MEIVAIAAACVVGIVFLVAGAAKLADRSRWSAEARELGIPSSLVPLLAVIPYAEIVVGAGLVAQVSRSVFATLALGLLVVFTVLVCRVLVSGRRPACACFGAWSARPIGASTVVRNGVFMVLCVLAIVA